MEVGYGTTLRARATNVSGKKKYKFKITVLYFVDKCENTIFVLLNLLEHVLNKQPINEFVSHIAKAWLSYVK